MQRGSRETGLSGVRGVSIAAFVSVLVHAGAIAWVAASDLRSIDDDEPPSIFATAPEQPVPQNPPEDPVLEVTFFTYSGNAGGDGIVSSREVAAPRKRGDNAKQGRGDFSTANGGVELGTGTEPSRSPYMKMRGPEKPQLKGLSSDFWAKFAENTKPLPPPPDIPG